MRIKITKYAVILATLLIVGCNKPKIENEIPVRIKIIEKSYIPGEISSYMYLIIQDTKSGREYFVIPNHGQIIELKHE